MEGGKPKPEKNPCTTIARRGTNNKHNPHMTAGTRN